MSEWIQRPGQYVVTAILPRRASSEVVDFLLDCPARHLLAINARGTLVKDRWYQGLIPVISPEQELLQFLLPEQEVDILMEKVVALGQLRLAGAGAIYTVPCERTLTTPDFPTWQNGALSYPPRQVAVAFKKNLVAIAAIVQTRSAEAVARAAIKHGAHGPTIHYCEGRGLRDRLGWLRFTHNPDKETILVVVDEMDAEAVFAAMARAGRLTEPGRGIIYQVPVHHGVINLPGVTQSARHSASIQQIIHAIDDLKGGADWRALNHLEEAAPKAGPLRFLGLGPSRPGRRLSALKRLVCVTKRKQVETLLDAAIAAGAPAATTLFGKFVESESAVTRAGVRLNRELGTIQFVLPPGQVDTILGALRETTDARGLESVCLYTQPVGQALTYMG